MPVRIAVAGGIAASSLPEALALVGQGSGEPCGGDACAAGGGHLDRESCLPGRCGLAGYQALSGGSSSDR